MKTHRQELAQHLGHGTSNVIANTASDIQPANEAPVANVTDNMAYTQEVELIEVSCPTDVHLNQALQATQLGQPKTIVPQYQQQQPSTHELDHSGMVQQPAVIQDYRNITDLQLQNVFNPQVCVLIIGFELTWTGYLFLQYEGRSECFFASRYVRLKNFSKSMHQ